MPFTTGQVIHNRYRIVVLLGQGGMGAVYRAWDTNLNIPVALKEMTSDPNGDLHTLAQLRQQFKHEAQVVAGLNHPNLVRVTDYFSWDGAECLVMNFVEGESLAERIQRERAQPEAQVIEWARQLLDALTYCHARGVIHRDVKPQNVIITPEGKPVLVDFGLVKLWDPRDPRTQTVIRAMGTPEYAPPEQYSAFAGHTDPRSDLYSLGATLYHALTGQAPISATDRMAMPEQFASPRTLTPHVSPQTEVVVLKAMEMAMNRRYQSAGAMAEALGGAARPSPVTPRRTRDGTLLMPDTEARPAPKKRSGLWIGLAVAGVLCLMLAAGGGAIAYITGRATPTPVPVAVQPSATATPSPTPTQRPVPTPTPRPTGTPEGAAPVGEGVLFQDDFSDPGSGWDVGDWDGGSVGYRDGTYFMRSEDKDWYYQGCVNRSFADLVIEVDATQILAPANNNSYGVGCRIQLNGGYYFLISGDGYYSIFKEAKEESELLVDWTRSTAIRQGNVTNHIQAVCDGDHLALFVNGELLAEAQDDTYRSGDIALRAGTGDDEPTEIHFDNLVVRRPAAILFQYVDIPPGNPIRIGYALVIAGPNESLGVDSRNGIEIALDDKGWELLGHPLELVGEDAMCSAEGGQTALTKLVSDPSLIGIIGTNCSSAGEPASRIASDAGMVLLSPSNTAPSLTNPDLAWNAGYFRICHNDNVQGAAMAHFVYDGLGLRTAATIHDGSPYADQLQEVFAETFRELGGTITAQEAVNWGDTDMRPILTAIAVDSPDFLYYPIFIPEGAQITMQAKEIAGLENTILAAADGCYSPDFVEAAGDACEGIYISGPNLAFENPIYDHFLEVHQEKYGEWPLSVFHAHAYDATMMLLAAIEKVAIQDYDGTLHIGRQALRDALYGTRNFEGITGNLTCDQYGDCADPEIAVNQITNGEYVPFWTYAP